MAHDVNTTETAAGLSAEREYARRRQGRRRRARTRYGAVGAILTAVAAEPRDVYAWRQGADGEAATARALGIRLGGTDVIVMHDRRIPGRGRANIDHIAIGPSGITVIDTKSSRGRVEVRTAGIVNRREQLLVNGRDRTSQLESLERQIEVVAAVLVRSGAGHVPLRGALCFPFMRRQWLHSGRVFGELIAVDDPAHVAKQLRRPGPIGLEEINRLADVLRAALPPAR
jgi:hypothetical protein